MNKVRIAKFLMILSLIIMITLTVVTQVNAYDWNVDSFDSAEDMGGINDTATNIVGAIVNVVRTVALGVAIIMLAFVAMKYMSSAPGDRAEIKKHAVIYVVGAIVLFGTSGILTILKDFADNI